jgi:hypothetical protein
MTDKQKRLGAGRRLRNYFLTGLIIVAPLGHHRLSHLDLHRLGRRLGEALYSGGIYNPETICRSRCRVWSADSAVPDHHDRVSDRQSGRPLDHLLRGIAAGPDAAGAQSLQGAQADLPDRAGRAKQFFQAGRADRVSATWLWSIVFIATDTKGEVNERLPEDESISVFLPTTPNPTSGFLLFVPRKDVIILDMSVEEAAKMVISAGLVSPDYPRILPVRQNPKSKIEPAHP